MGLPPRWFGEGKLSGFVANGADMNGCREKPVKNPESVHTVSLHMESAQEKPETIGQMTDRHSGSRSVIW